MASRHLKIALLAGSLSVTGCVNLAPLYQQPEATIPAEIPSAPTGIAIDSPLAWDQVFLSEDLRSLIEIALEENRDLRVTAANIEIARAQYNIAQSSLLPNASISGNLTEGGRFDGSGTNTSAFRDSALFQLGVTGFELDFFSRVRNQNEAAFQSYLATVDGERAARIALIASVAELWVRLATDRELLALAEDTVDIQSDSLSLTQELLSAGVATELDTRRASASVENARAQAAQFEAQIRQDLNALRLVVGTELPAYIEGSAALTPSPVELLVPGNISSEVLLNRPDVMAAERNLVAANANIGSARAALFPSISLSGRVGYSSSDLENFFANDVAGWTFGPSLDLPIFDYGARQNRIAVTEAQQEQAVARYQLAIQTAFRETADALAITETIDTRLNALERLSEDADVTLNLSQERFRVGVDDYLSVLDAQREDYSARQQLILARRDRALNAIALYRALGAAPSAESE